MAEGLPHLTIEELDASIKALSTLREFVTNPELETSFRLVLTELHTVARNARDISDGI
jgi:hypothetical protein